MRARIPAGAASTAAGLCAGPGWARPLGRLPAETGQGWIGLICYRGRRCRPGSRGGTAGTPLGRLAGRRKGGAGVREHAGGGGADRRARVGRVPQGEPGSRGAAGGERVTAEAESSWLPGGRERVGLARWEAVEAPAGPEGQKRLANRSVSGSPWEQAEAQPAGIPGPSRWVPLGLGAGAQARALSWRAAPPAAVSTGQASGLDVSTAVADPAAPWRKGLDAGQAALSRKGSLFPGVQHPVSHTEPRYQRIPSFAQERVLGGNSAKLAHRLFEQVQCLYSLVRHMRAR